ncbi:isochorismate synthase [Enterococcus sp. LJL99]
MSIPEELIAAFDLGYRQFSWIESINENREIMRNYFFKAQNEFQGTRFYWQTPEKDITLVGFGQEIVLKEKQAHFSKVATVIAREKQARFQNKLIEGTGALLFGAFAFDESTETQTEWGELGQGFFSLPSFLITEKNNEQFLSINFKAETKEALVDEWTKRKQFFYQLKCESVPSFQKPMIVETNEIEVSKWMSLVEETVAMLKKENPLEKVVLARRMKIKSDSAIQADFILKNLQEQQNNTYFFVLEGEGHLFIGATPERLLKASKTNFSTVSVAGSTPRGKTQAEDQQLGTALLGDTKNRYEHQIVVERIMKEMTMMTETRIQATLPRLLKNADIQHLFVSIEARRDKELLFLNAIRQLHPTPALGGEPKAEALKWIKERESFTRGLYGGPVGWLGIKEDVGEFAVGIRSAVFSKKEGYLFAGCGIVQESIAESERIETQVKFQPMLKGIGETINEQSK